MQILNHRKNIVRNIMLILFGNALMALTVVLFFIPSELVCAGTTGIALALNHSFGITISGFVFFFNLIMLAAGYFLIGRNFAVSTILSSVSYPVLLDVFQKLLKGFVLTTDPVLCTVFAGLGFGIALGIVIRTGSSTGGMDIPPLVLQKYAHIPVSIGMYFFDFCIVVLQAAFSNREKLLYGIIAVLIYSYIIDKVLIFGNAKTQVKIISRQPQLICNAILQDVDRGVTLLHSRGGYSGNDNEVLLSVINNRELPRVLDLIQDLDPESFLIISRVSEVRGRGFSINKQYR